jgi:hypothetical protein
MSDDPTRGLYGKYRVERIDGKSIKGGRCIVLEVGDPNAWPALSQWAETVHTAGYLDLAADVRRLLIEAREAALSGRKDQADDR